MDPGHNPKDTVSCIEWLFGGGVKFLTTGGWDSTIRIYDI